MRRLLLLTVAVFWGAESIARIFRDNSHYRPHYISSSYSSKRYLRSPDTRFSRSRVFRNVVVNANDEPRLRSQGRFYKRAQAVPIHDPSQNPIKDSIQIAAYSYDEEKHHEKKLVEDSMTMVEAHEFARGLERTTVSVRTEDSTTTPVPPTTPVQFTAALRAQPKPEFQQPPPVFIQSPQPAPAFKQPPGARTFSQTVQAGGGLNGQFLPGRSSVLINGPFSVQPQPQPFPAGFLPAVPGTPALPVRIGLPPDPLVPPFGVPPPTAIVSPTSSSNVPNFPPPPNIQPQPPQNQLPPPLPGQASGSTGAILPHNGQPPIPVRDTRFEVINQQAANSSLEQLGCGFDWISNTCKDIFNIGWCGRCHDFGSPPFIHDCKCTHPLVQLPPRPTPPPQPRPALLRYI